MNSLGFSVTASTGRLIPIYSNYGLDPGRGQMNSATIKLRKTHGYESNKAQSSELHSAITAASRVAANSLAASFEASIETSVVYDIRNSLNIQNTAEGVR